MTDVDKNAEALPLTKGGKRCWSTKSLEFEVNSSNELSALLIENLESVKKNA